MASSSFAKSFGSFVPSPLWGNGPGPGQFYSFPGNSTLNQNTGSQRTLAPAVTTTSVLGIKFKDGVVLAADMLGSYGSLARFRNCSRLLNINQQTVLGSSGDFADFQFLTSIVEQRVIEEECLDDGFKYTPSGLHSWLTRVLYNRRSQFNPLWNTYIVGGMEADKPFLGYVNMIGIAYEADTVASGFGSYLALPMLRDALEKNKNLDEKQAVDVIQRCMKLLFYRDARSFDKYEIAIVTKKGAEIQGPLTVEANWDIAHAVSGYE
ncbi:hypothetical protein C0Q70_03211 [Pomacea canaliculata]|uniref:Proteasome subunit beta n=1 Tax=Pomacea canaliculata TaxID=400727 RepID=A0A2T7PS28_POMCA|nr:proteasome subunit beta type-4-like [Pomacea canaliculata]PVD36233.1 hypothetical protein C0Q70_03211 [Pomacea canaliculata]